MTKNRFFETGFFCLYDYYRYLSAFEVSSSKIKQFKTERITDVELTGKPFKHKEKHKKLNVGIFGVSVKNLGGFENKQTCKPWRF